MITALIIFAVTYALISLRGNKRLKIGRTGAALLGAAAMIVFGVVTPMTALGSVNTDVLFLLMGMMALVVGLEYCGFFEIISDWMISRFAAGPKLLAVIMCLNALLSALMLNDAVVLLFTPIVIRCCIALKADLVPYLVGTMISANIGSVATAIGNPQNAFIVSEHGISFMQFLANQLPTALVCLPIAYFMLLLFFRRRLSTVVDSESEDEERMNIDRTRLGILLFVALLTFVGFAFSGKLGIPMSVPALIAGAIALIVVISKEPEKSGWAIRRIDWSILLFFIGLFILMKGVEVSGLLSELTELTPGFGQGETPTLASTAGLAILLSNLVSNVPAVMLLNGMIPQVDVFIYTLAASTTLAGNATLLGSACNIIVAEKAAARGIKIDFWKYMVIGIPIAVVTVFVNVMIHSFIF